MYNSDQERFPSRKNPRLKYYDYSTPNYYFVTICTRNRRYLFGKPRDLNFCGKIAERGIGEIKKHFPQTRIDNYVVMPNHVHMIVVLEEGAAELPVVIGQYKAFVTKEIHKRIPNCKVWQTSFHDHVIRNQTAYEKIWLYIETNPENWGKDCFFQEDAVNYK